MNILTFDIEDWFHILEHDSTRTSTEWVKFPTRIHEPVNRILNLLCQNKVKATFFCLGWIVEQYPELIKKIDEMGHEIGTHSYSHQLIQDQSFKEVKQDLERSVKVIEDLIGKKVRCYRAPGLSVSKKTPWIIDLLSENGIEIDCSISPTKHSHGGETSFTGKKPQYIRYNGIKIKEFPLNYLDLHGAKLFFTGGGYFRLYPYYLIATFIHRSDYVMTYFHPRDFDPDQPLIDNLSLLRKFKSYCGLSTSYSKLSSLINEFQFCSLYQADKMINWESAPIYDFN